MMKGFRNGRFVGGAAALSAAVFGCATPASGALIAGWNFNGYNGSDHVIVADWGTGTLTIDSGWLGADLDTDLGTLFNAYLADPAGTAISLEVGQNQANNGRWIEFEISTVGLENLVLTFVTDGANGAFNSNQLAYSTDGVSYTDFGAPYAPSGYQNIMTFDFSAIGAVEDQSQVFIRIVFDGAITNNANKGNAIDNIQFNATAIPAPGSIALLGLAGLIGFRRRRRA